MLHNNFKKNGQFKELTKYKHVFKLYIYIYELYYASYYIFLSVSMHMHKVIS